MFLHMLYIRIVADCTQTSTPGTGYDITEFIDVIDPMRSSFLCPVWISGWIILKKSVRKIKQPCIS